MTNVISEQWSAMDRDIRSLSSLVKSLQANVAVAAALPNTAKGRENDPIEHITIEERTGKEAQRLAATCYQDLHIDSHFSQKSARRTVGVLWFSPTPTDAISELVELVKRVNEAKASIEEHVTKNYSSRQERFEALRAACPGVMTVHLYRKIRCYNLEDVSTARFTWQRKDVLIRPEKAELLRRINEELVRSGPDHQLPLEQLIHRISGVPAARLRVRRKVKVQPVANVRVAGVVQTVTAPMPIIIIQKAAPVIKMLSSFHASDRRQTRSDKVDAELLGTFGGVSIEAFP
jgi:DNA replication terminus site-binding protein